MKRTFFVTLVLCLTCLAGLVVGVLIAASPTYVEGGVVGWYNGHKFDPKTNILGLSSAVWLMDCLLSIVLGVVIMLVAGFVGVWLGITSAVLGMLSARQRERSTEEGASLAGPSAERAADGEEL
jgi:hypothetical protein